MFHCVKGFLVCTVASCIHLTFLLFGLEFVDGLM